MQYMLVSGHTCAIFGVARLYTTLRFLSHDLIEDGIPKDLSGLSLPECPALGMALNTSL